MCGDDFDGYKNSVLGIPTLPVWGKTSQQYPMFGKNKTQSLWQQLIGTVFSQDAWEYGLVLFCSVIASLYAHYSMLQKQGGSMMVWPGGSGG